MQQCACERQDRQTTLGPQTFQETFQQARHRQSLQLDSEGLFVGTGNIVLPKRHSLVSAVHVHPKNPKHPRTSAEGRQTKLQQEAVPSKITSTMYIQIALFSFPCPQKSLKMFQTPVIHSRTCTHKIYAATTVQMLENSKTSRDTVSSVITHQDHPSCRLQTLQTSNPYGMKIKLSKVSGSCSITDKDSIHRPS